MCEFSTDHEWIRIPGLSLSDALHVIAARTEQVPNWGLRTPGRNMLCSRMMGTLLLTVFLVVQGPPAGESATPAQTAPPQQPAEQSPPPPAADTQPPVISSPPSTGKVILKTIWSDQKAIWTSPFRMNRQNAGWWAFFGSGTAVLIATDQRTSNALADSPGRIEISNNISRIGAVYTTLPAAGAFYLYGRARNDPRARETGVLGAQAMLDSFILVSVLKFAAGRERPDLPGGEGRFFKGKDSFPSGHSMMGWSFASVIAHEYKHKKAVPIIAYSLASVVSVSRFTGKRHFASDVLAGGAMGWFTGTYVFHQHSDSSIHKSGIARSRYMPQIYPSMDPLSRSYSLSLAWYP